MKIQRSITVLTLLAGATSLYAQGQITMVDYGGDTAIQVFAAQSLAASTVKVSYGGYTGYEEMGQTANSYASPTGNTVYANNVVLGPGYDVGLLIAPGLNAPLSALTLVPSSIVTTWFNLGNPSTGVDGFWKGYFVATIQGIHPTQMATVAYAAWQANGPSGPADTLAVAQALGYNWGISQTGNMQMGGVEQGYGVVQPAEMPSSMVSFSLATNISQVPEPSSIAFLVMGGTLTFRRFKKSR